MGINAEEYDLFVKKMGADDTTYVPIGCIQGESGMLSKGEREVKISECANIGADDEKSLKKIKYDSATFSYNFDPADTEGKKVVNDAYEDGKEKLTIKLVLDDKTDGQASGTFIERDVLVSKIEPSRDGDWKEEVTVALIGKYRLTAAA